jgi:hypothetical protein
MNRLVYDSIDLSPYYLPEGEKEKNNGGQFVGNYIDEEDLVVDNSKGPYDEENK